MENFKDFNPVVELSRQEQAAIVATYATPGFALIINKIFRPEVDSFILDLINAPSGNDAVIIAKHNLAKAAAQFLTRGTERVNECVLQYSSGLTGNEKPVDITEGKLDIGELASTFDDVQHEAFEEGLEHERY